MEKSVKKRSELFAEYFIEELAGTIGGMCTSIRESKSELLDRYSGGREFKEFCHDRLFDFTAVWSHDRFRWSIMYVLFESESLANRLKSSFMEYIELRASLSGIPFSYSGIDEEIFLKELIVMCSRGRVSSHLAKSAEYKLLESILEAFERGKIDKERLGNSGILNGPLISPDISTRILSSLPPWFSFRLRDFSGEIRSTELFSNAELGEAMDLNKFYFLIQEELTVPFIIINLSEKREPEILYFEDGKARPESHGEVEISQFFGGKVFADVSRVALNYMANELSEVEFSNFTETMRKYGISRSLDKKGGVMSWSDTLKERTRKSRLCHKFGIKLDIWDEPNTKGVFSIGCPLFVVRKLEYPY